MALFSSSCGSRSRRDGPAMKRLGMMEINHPAAASEPRFELTRTGAAMPVWRHLKVTSPPANQAHWRGNSDWLDRRSAAPYRFRRHFFRFADGFASGNSGISDRRSTGSSDAGCFIGVEQAGHRRRNLPCHHAFDDIASIRQTPRHEQAAARSLLADAFRETGVDAPTLGREIVPERHSR